MHQASHTESRGKLEYFYLRNAFGLVDLSATYRYRYRTCILVILGSSVADPDPGSGAFNTLDSGSGSGMNFFRIPEPG
jgi:hypothetical protein